MFEALKNKKIVIFGFGTQGRAQALNLKDSGFTPTICLPEISKTIAEAKTYNLNVVADANKAVKQADIVLFLTPDAIQPKLYKEIESSLRAGSTLVFAHGLNIHYGLITPRNDLDVILVAPMPHGSRVRTMYLKKEMIPTIVAVGQDVTKTSWQVAEDLAKGMGAGEQTIIKSTFAEETETDLFAEQVLLVGGLKEMITAAFETLVKAGYSPEIAYYCCLKETEIMSEMFARNGISGTLKSISDTARYGAISRGPRVIDEHVKENMKKVLEEIRDNTFINELKENKIKVKIKEHKIDTLHECHCGPSNDKLRMNESNDA